MTQLIRIIRPANFFVAIAATVVGAMLCSGVSVIPQALLAGFATALVLAAGNILNDIFDVEIDKYAHPQRPLPAGEMSKTAATVASIVFWAIAIVISAIFLSPNSVFVVLLAFFLLALYSTVLSRTVLVGNLVVALLCGVAVVFGAYATTDYDMCSRALWAGLIATAVHFPREIFKDIEDAAADKRFSRASFAISFGEKFALKLGAFFCLVAMFVMELPFMLGTFSPIYGGASIFAFCLCGLSAAMAFKGYASRSQRLLKIALIAGLVALFAEAFS